MSAGKIRQVIVSERLAWIRDMLDELRSLPLSSYEEFVQDRRTPAAAESFLRRALEALLDLGRHILAKGFAVAPAEYKEVCDRLAELGVLSETHRLLMRRMAGYRNRLVHFYQEVSREELYEICRGRLGDMEDVCEGIIRWLRDNPDYLDTTI